MAKLDGTGRRRIAEVETLATFLAVDSKGGSVFWVSVEHDAIPAKITAAGADGSKSKVIVTLAKGRIEGLAVDEDARRIVWLERTNSAPARIRSARFDGTSAMTIHEFTGEHFARAVAVGPLRK